MNLVLSRCKARQRAVLAFVIGARVLGAFASRKTSGFAAPGLKTLVAALSARG